MSFATVEGIPTELTSPVIRTITGTTMIGEHNTKWVSRPERENKSDQGRMVRKFKVCFLNDNTLSCLPAVRAAKPNTEIFTDSTEDGGLIS